VSGSTDRPLVINRLISVALCVLVVPLVVAIAAYSGEQAAREGEPAPRTIFADEQLIVTDEDATETARRQAAESVAPVQAADSAAQSAIVRDVREVFQAARDVRAPVQVGDDLPTSPAPSSQREALAEQEPDLDEDVVAELVELSDQELDVVERETIAAAQELARQQVTEEDLPGLIDQDLPVELALRSFPGGTADTIARPLLDRFLRPTVAIDPEATAAARQREADAVPDVTRTWRPGEAIVREGQIIDPMQFRALELLGVDGATIIGGFLQGVLAMLVVTAVAAVYLQRMQPRVWRSGKKLLLLGLLVVAYAALVAGASVLVGAASAGWAYVVPAGAFAMLTALLIHPVVGIATMLPAAVIAMLVVPVSPAIGLFAAAIVLISVPLTTRIASRSDLRSATLRAGITYPVVAAAVVLVFGPSDDLFTATLAAALNGLITAVVVQGAMPFLETMFRLPTVTALLDLNARDHPLLRELEAKALGSYNHSVMVAALTERACRAVGADPLLGSVAALYHDIGKVRQPHFFIENQQGIANPHDELEPEVSAVIIQNHVVDGVEMAVEHHLPPEVVACIGSHHGTMLVSYFYEQAVRAAGGDRSAVDEQHFRYKGRKPRSKEAAILLLADCCEATTRSMAMSRGTLPREDIESTVDRLLAERVDDGQFEDSDLTFRELMTARDTIVESLVGIYHPRIAYPPKEPATATDADGPTSAAGAPDPDSGPSDGQVVEPSSDGRTPAGDEVSPGARRGG
jgi:cyclic-di-AMP phosphodiesterase PgpH